MSGKVLSLHTPLADYLTLTSFDDDLHGWVKGVIGETEGVPEKRHLYEGEAYDVYDGTIFTGSAFQDGRAHYIMQASGESAARILPACTNIVKNGLATCTRIDLQVTIPYPRTWSQWDFLNDMHTKGRIVQWRESRDRDGRAQTVYIGNRQSERFTRLYMKTAHGGAKLLRLEVEYKGNRAKAMMRSIAAGRTCGEYLAHELQTTFDHDRLSALFSPSLDGVKPHTERVRLTSSTQKTEKWLVTQVLPAFQKAINAHDADRRIMQLFIDAINERLDNE